MSPDAPKPSPQTIRWGQEVLLLLWVALMLCAADQWSKGWAVERLGPLTRDWTGRLRPPPDKRPVQVIDGALRFSITGNEGAIWGLGRNLSNRFKRPFFIAMSLAAVVFIILLIRASTPQQRPRRIGLAAVLSGAAGNLADRVRHDHVVDFIDWYYAYNWPTFNVADVAITAGVILVIVDLWWHPDPEEDDGSWWPFRRRRPTGPAEEAPPTAETDPPARDG